MIFVCNLCFSGVMWRNHHQPSYLQILSGGMFDIHIYIYYIIYIYINVVVIINYVYIRIYFPGQSSSTYIHGCFMLFLKLAGVSIDFSRANNLTGAICKLRHQRGSIRRRAVWASAV